VSGEVRSAETKDPSYVAPFLRWAGSKRAVLPELRRLMPTKFKRYIEPFAGSACLFFSTHPKMAVLSDLNDELIDTYRAIKSAPSEVGHALNALPFGRDAYYQIRNEPLCGLSPVQKAAKFIYLNRFCFNGLYRTNASGEFNVPFGAPRNSTVPSISHLELCSKALQSASLMAGDFESIVSENIAEGDFIYLDPPFFQTEGRVFRQYNAKPFMKSDLERLGNLLHHIHSVGATFVLSYANNAEAEAIFSGWHSKTILLQRNISGFAKARGKAKEIFVSNRALGTC
jgi:DNA adenine methylase